MIRIDGGVSYIDWGNEPPTFKYTVQDSDGERSYIFSVTDGGEWPKLGDNLQPGPLLGGTTYSATLVRGTFPIINNDPGFQAKRDRPDVWPIEGRDS